MKTPTFKEWYNANRRSVILNDEYSEYKFECKEQMGVCYVTFKEWMKERYDSLITNQQL